MDLKDVLLLRQDLGECYDAVVQSAAAAVGAEACTLSLYDAATDELIARRPHYGAPTDPTPRFRFPIRSAPASERAIRTGQPYLSNDPGHDPLYDASAVERGLRSVVTVPIKRAGRVIGLLYAVNKEGGFSAEDVARLADLSDVVGVGLENIRLYAELAEAQQQVAEYAQQLEERVRVSDQKYGSLMEHASDAIFLLDVTGSVLETNRRAEQMLGRDRDQIVGRGFEGFFPERGRAQVRARFEAMLETGQLREDDALLVRPDGEKVPADLSAALVRLGEARVVFAIARDATQRKRAEAALRESEARFRMMFDDSPLPTWFAEAGSLRLLEANEAACTLYGYDRDELLGMRMGDLDAEGQPPPPTSGPSERRHERKDGSPLNVLLFSHALEIAGRPGVLVVAQDVTERRRLQAQLLQAQKMEAVGRLAAGLAHDFGNALTVIIGYGDMLLDATDPDDPRRDDIEQIYRAAERSTRLTRQLMAFSRRQVVEPRVLDLNVVVADMEKMLRRVISEDVELVNALVPGALAVRADPVQIEQVVLNLVVNARDAMPGGGHLVIGTERVPGSARLTVADTGCGMDEATRSRIFEPFFTTKEPGKGTGLGLSTVYGIVEQMGGRIEVDTAPGQGTTFRVDWPALSETELLEEGTPRAAAAGPGGSGTILLVEDDPRVRRFSRSVLLRAGYEVLEAPGGAEALDIARNRSGPIDLLVTDAVMPGISGRELAARLQALRPETRRLLVSGYPQGEADLGGEPFLPKPFTRAVLLAKVHEVLARPATAPPPEA